MWHHAARARGAGAIRRSHARDLSPRTNSAAHADQRGAVSSLVAAAPRHRRPTIVVAIAPPAAAGALRAKLAAHCHNRHGVLLLLLHLPMPASTPLPPCSPTAEGRHCLWRRICVLALVQPTPTPPPPRSPPSFSCCLGVHRRLLLYPLYPLRLEHGILIPRGPGPRCASAPSRRVPPATFHRLVVIILEMKK